MNFYNISHDTKTQRSNTSNKSSKSTTLLLAKAMGLFSEPLQHVEDDSTAGLAAAIVYTAQCMEKQRKHQNCLLSLQLATFIILHSLLPGTVQQNPIKNSSDTVTECMSAERHHKRLTKKASFISLKKTVSWSTDWQFQANAFRASIKLSLIHSTHTGSVQTASLFAHLTVLWI